MHARSCINEPQSVKRAKILGTYIEDNAYVDIYTKNNIQNSPISIIIILINTNGFYIGCFVFPFEPLA